MIQLTGDELNTISPFTLNFHNTELERAYRDYDYEHSKQAVRLALLLGILIVLVLAPVDVLIFADQVKTVWMIRFAVVIPVILFGLWSSYRPWFARAGQYVIAGGLLIIGLAFGLGPLLFEEPNIIYFSLTVIHVTMFGYAMLKLRFLLSAITSWTFILTNAIVVTVVDAAPIFYTHSMVTLLVSGVLLTVGSYNSEWATRKAYYAHTQLLKSERLQYQAEHARIQWLENMARFLRHELRNTLVGVKTSLDLLQRRASLTEDDTHLVRARKGLRLIGHMLESVTQATSIESSFMKETPEPVAVDQVIREQVENYHEIYPDHQIELRSEGDEIRVRGREERIVQLLDKLVSNAVDHSKPNTPIVISCRKEGGKAILNVRNEGAPLPEDKTAMFDLFASFRQPSEDEGKRGIGLYVVRLIAERYGGRVTARDLLGRVGAEFSVVLPTV